ncbi:MAG: tRNA (guanosine(37)-N1)-methyltransferase TrmD [Clostridia bacterium]|nr:tRNA (guanosine(37)-N1)-methyltransferase TrmD [Clostridia bacterium]
MRIDVLTLFPEEVDAYLNTSIIGRGRRDGLLDIRCVNVRDFCTDKYRRTDDYPYGGGQGMIMLCEPLYNCLTEIKGGEKVHTVLTSPRGKTFTQARAKELLALDRFIIVCGPYEGVDQRFIDECIDEEISLGDFVLTGGETAACAITDAVCRMVPGVLSETASFEDESHFSGALEYPQYTRPEVWHGKSVPDVLLSGHHENIRKWRRRQQLEITRKLRPDMFQKLELTKEDKKLLEDIQK